MRFNSFSKIKVECQEGSNKNILNITYNSFVTKHANLFHKEDIFAAKKRIDFNNEQSNLEDGDHIIAHKVLDEYTTILEKDLENHSIFDEIFTATLVYLGGVKLFVIIVNINDCVKNIEDGVVELKNIPPGTKESDEKWNNETVEFFLHSLE